jgi:hypothetical protein
MTAFGVVIGLRIAMLNNESIPTTRLKASPAQRLYAQAKAP